MEPVQMEILDLSETSKEAQLQHAETLRRFEAQQRARTVIVPTDIEEVKKKLREMGHPITLFGEGPADRRERLKEVVASLELSAEEVNKVQQLMNIKSNAKQNSNQPENQVNQKKELFYTQASTELIQARINIAQYSFQKTHERLLNIKKIRESDILQLEEDKSIALLYSDSNKTSLIGSQYADDRPLSFVRSSPSGKYFASASLNPVVKLWDSRHFNCVASLNGHLERITSLCWHPNADEYSADEMNMDTDTDMNINSRPSLLASTSADGACMIWDTRPKNLIESNDDKSKNVKLISPLIKLHGHQGIISSAEFHPAGNLIGTAGHDFSWRLWDIESGKELLLQDGHIKECSVITFQNDGALVFTADWAGVGLLWDLRSGQAIHTFQGHIKKIVNAHFSPIGYQVATCSVDNMVRIWDIRKKKCGYCLPAHSNIISDVRYSKSGELLLTSSFDGTVKIWGSRDYRLMKSLSGHTGKVMSCDFLGSERKIVSVIYSISVHNLFFTYIFFPHSFPGWI